MKNLVEIGVIFFLTYLVVGLIVAILIQFSGLRKIDPGTEGGGFWFRLLTFPGIVFLWPIILNKWIRSIRKHHEH